MKHPERITVWSLERKGGCLAVLFLVAVLCYAFISPGGGNAYHVHTAVIITNEEMPRHHGGYACSPHEERVYSPMLRVNSMPPPPTPFMVGIATHYDADTHNGRYTKSGEPYDADAFCAAVPHELWELLRGKMLRVVYGDADVVVRVNDCGLLTEAGYFTWTEKQIGKYIVEWFFPSKDGYRVVIDLTPAAYEKLSPRGVVQVYIIDGGNYATQGDQAVGTL